MNELGEQLKKCRHELGLSLKDVSLKTGITDSRLSKIENGQLKCPVNDLHLLAKVFKLPVIDMFITAGYLNKDDLKDYQLVFKGVEELDADDRQLIQENINRFIQKRRPHDDI